MASRCAWLLVCGDVDEIGFGNPRRLLEDRTRDLDVVVERESPHHLHRRVADRRQTVDNSVRAWASISAIKPAEHLVEQSDMIVVEAARAIEKERRDALERLGAALRRAAAGSPLPVPE